MYQCYRGKCDRVSVNFCSETNLLADVLNAPWHSEPWNDGQMEERAFRIKVRGSQLLLKFIPMFIQQDANLHSLFISGNCSTCFGWYFHPSSGAHTTLSTASGICHTVTAICRYRGRGITVCILLDIHWNNLKMHGPMKVKFANISFHSKLQNSHIIQKKK
jgi:hypothetical protein